MTDRWDHIVPSRVRRDRAPVPTRGRPAIVVERRGLLPGPACRRRLRMPPTSSAGSFAGVLCAAPTPVPAENADVIALNPQRERTVSLCGSFFPLDSLLYPRPHRASHRRGARGLDLDISSRYVLLRHRPDKPYRLSGRVAQMPTPVGGGRGEQMAK